MDAYTELVNHLEMLKEVKKGNNKFMMFKDIAVCNADYFQELLFIKEKYEKIEESKEAYE